MQNVFSKMLDLRTSDFDCRRKIMPSSVLDIFQAVAGEHAVELGCGFDTLITKQLLWVLIRTKYTVLNDPAMYERVRVKTWPLPPSRVGFQREYLIESEDGKPLVKGTSDWVVIHSEKRKIMPAGNVYPENFEFCKDKMYETRSGKVPDFENTSEGIKVCPGFSQLDMNGHVNNTKYANYAMDAIDPTENDIVESFQIDYRHEVQRGDELTVVTERRDSSVLVKGVNTAGETMFSCEVVFK